MAMSRVSTCSFISSESIGKRLNKWANKRLKHPSTSGENFSVERARGIQDIGHLFRIRRLVP